MQHDFILLDRSQSMESLWGEALAAINGYVKKLADDNVDTGVTLATFDLHDQKLVFDVIRDRIIPNTWLPVSTKDAAPRGMTPLNDAVGRLVTLANSNNYEKVAIIILTDGQENASKELSVNQAKAILDSCRAKGWQVIFLGANFDNAAQATSYGARSAQTAKVDPAQLDEAFRKTAFLRSSYGSGAAATMEFTDEDKKEFSQ